MPAGSPESQNSTLYPRGLKAALTVCILVVGALSLGSYDASAQIQQNGAAVSTRAGGAVIEIEKQRSVVAEKLNPEHSFALVLGIDTFDEDRVWHRLPGVLKEIKEVRAAFESHEFKVFTNLFGEDEANEHLKPLSAEELNHRINEFLEIYGRHAENRLVIYIATHGHADRGSDGNPESRGYGYLITKDSPDPRARNFTSHAYSVTQLALGLQDRQAQHIYLFFNACFSGAMIPKIPSRKKSEDALIRDLDENVADWAQRLLAYNARLILTAGSDDQTVPDENNPFSQALIEGLAGAADLNKDGLILGSELASYIHARVAYETRSKLNHANDPVFAFMPKKIQPNNPRTDLKLKQPPALLDYAQNGDFVFLSPLGARRDAPEGQELANLQLRLPKTQSIDCPDCPIMVRVPGSEKVSPKVSPFALAQTETTFVQWDACYRDFHCHTWIDDHGLGRGDRPVSGVTWLDTLEFISWLNSKKAENTQCENYRLPTPAEWTFAARGNRKTRYPWGESVVLDQANCWDCGSAWDGIGPAPVKRFQPNVFDLYDMIGNVWEWVESPDNKCIAENLGENGPCPDGSVMGGAFSTKLKDITFETMGSIPRTSNNKHSYRLASVGLRVACSLQKGQAAANSN